ncbi:hypothetical protein [Plantactinospora sp. DSM 117369]
MNTPRPSDQSAARRNRLQSASNLPSVYSDALRPPCYGLATIYYEAVRIFGRPNVTAEQLKAAEELMPEGTTGKAPLAKTG